MIDKPIDKEEVIGTIACKLFITFAKTMVIHKTIFINNGKKTL